MRMHHATVIAELSMMCHISDIDITVEFITASDGMDVQHRGRSRCKMGPASTACQTAAENRVAIPEIIGMGHWVHHAQHACTTIVIQYVII
jgi:hypothetical protein